MAATSSFDIVSKIDRQEADNALNQAAKELSQRFDFRGTGTTIRWSGEFGVELESTTEDRIVAALDVFKDKLVRRGVSLKALDAGEPRQSGKIWRLSSTLQNGLTSEQAKQVSAAIRELGIKNVKPQITGDEVRVTSKVRDDLQQVIAALKAKDFDFALQFTNYR